MAVAVAVAVTVAVAVARAWARAAAAARATPTGGPWWRRLGGGIVVAFLMSQLRPTFDSRRMLTDFTGLPVLGMVSMVVSPETIRRQRYGLAGYIWTNDLTRAHTFAQNVEAGMVWLNSHNVRDLRTPFGGVKASGLGHEGGYRSIDFYTDQQAVHITLGPVHTARFGATR